MLRRCCQVASRQIRVPVQSLAGVRPAGALQLQAQKLDQVRSFGTTAPTGDAGLGEKTKIATANALLKSLLSSTNGFDQAFHNLNIVRMGDGEISCSLEVDSKLENPFNALHGGAICTLVDFAGTLALMTRDPTRAGVSVDLSVSFISSAKAGDELDIRGKVLKTGKKLGFTEVEIYNKGTGKLIASGRHTKYFS